MLRSRAELCVGVALAAWSVWHDPAMTAHKARRSALVFGLSRLQAETPPAADRPKEEQRAQTYFGTSIPMSEMENPAEGAKEVSSSSRRGANAGTHIALGLA